MAARTSVFHEEYGRIFQPVSYQAAVLVGADPSAAAEIPAKTGHANVIQRVTFNVTTDDAHSVTVRDDATTPVVAAIFPSSPGIGTRQISYMPQGMEMTEAKNIDVYASGTGLVGTLLIEGYYRPIGTRTSL